MKIMYITSLFSDLKYIEKINNIISNFYELTIVLSTLTYSDENLLTTLLEDLNGTEMD